MDGKSGGFPILLYIATDGSILLAREELNHNILMNDRKGYS